MSLSFYSVILSGYPLVKYEATNGKIKYYLDVTGVVQDIVSPVYLQRDIITDLLDWMVNFNATDSNNSDGPVVTNMELISLVDPIIGHRTDLRITWSPVVDSATVDYYKVRWKREGTSFSEYLHIEGNSWTKETVIATTYTFGVTTVFKNGTLSSESIFGYDVGSNINNELLPPTDLVIEGTIGNTFDTKDLIVSWMENPLNANLQNTSTAKYKIQVHSSVDDALLSTYWVDYPLQRFVLTYNEMVLIGTIQRTTRLKVFAEDSTGVASSTYVTNDFTNNVPPAPTLFVSTTDNTAFCTIGVAIYQQDIAGYLVHASNTPGFTPGPSTLIYDGPLTSPALQVTPSTTTYYKAAVYDVYGKDGLNYSTEVSNTSLDPSDFNVFVFEGLDFVVSGNTVSWSAGSVKLTKGPSFTPTNTSISAGSEIWTSGTLYIYYTVGATALSTSTSFGTAMGGNNSVVAVYKGGNDIIISNGKPIIDGNRIITNTIGANQLVAGTAVITGTAQIADGIITNAKIGNSIQSTSYNPSTYTGWEINKAGSITSYGSFNFYNNSGQLILGSSGIDYSNVFGTKPPSNATNGATWGSNISGQPTSLSGINSTEGTKLSGIATNATKNTTTSGTTGPTGGTNGDLFLRTDLGVVYQNNGGTWYPSGKIDANSIGTLIPTAIIGTAHITDANITTLKIAGGAVTANESSTAYYNATVKGSAQTITGLSITPTSVNQAINRIVTISFRFITADSTPGYFSINLRKGGVNVTNGSWAWDAGGRLSAGTYEMSFSASVSIPYAANNTDTIDAYIVLTDGAGVWTSDGTAFMYLSPIHMVCQTGKR